MVRNLATAIALLVAAASRRADAVGIAFLARVATEIGDAAIALPAGDLAGASVPGLMLAADLAALGGAWRATRSAG